MTVSAPTYKNHRSINVTVPIEKLRELSLPWPGGVQ